MQVYCHPDRPHCTKGLCRRCYDAKWKRDKRATDPEFKAKIYAATKQWHLDNPEYERERSKRRRLENPDYSKALIKDWWIRHPEKRKEYRNARRLRDPEQFRRKNLEYVKKRKARKKGASISDFTAAQWNNMKELCSFCIYCGSDSSPLTQDHLTPLSRGGAHTEANIAPACVTCNARKGTMTLEEYRVAPAS
jgi:5-methylcytosine-specific restriction endonuclease McrA